MTRRVHNALHELPGVFNSMESIRFCGAASAESPP